MANNGNHNEETPNIQDMPELDVREEVIEGNHGSGGGKGPAIFRKTGNRRLAGQILTAPPTIEDAAAWSAINLQAPDEVRKIHHILNAWAHCDEFNIECGKEDIRRYLLLMPAAGGWGRALAAMIETGIIVPSGLGVGKKFEEEVKRAVKKKEDEESQRAAD